MIDPTTQSHTFGPARNGSGWPYIILMIIGAALCLYLAADLYQTLASYAKAPATDFAFVAIIAGLGMVFLLAALAFWYFPWSWAKMRVDQNGITLHVTGMGRIPETHIPWITLDKITLMILPRGASVLSLTLTDASVKTVRTWAFAQAPDTYLPAFAECAETAGYTLNGSPLKSPILGKRSWDVQKAM